MARESDLDRAALAYDTGLEPGDEVGFHEAAKRRALAACKWAWADGEPWVRRYGLDQARAILDKLGEPYSELPDYDPAKDEEFDWEPDVRAAIEKLKAEREAEAQVDAETSE